MFNEYQNDTNLNPLDHTTRRSKQLSQTTLPPQKERCHANICDSAAHRDQLQHAMPSCLRKPRLGSVFPSFCPESVLSNDHFIEETVQDTAFSSAPYRG